MSTKTVYIFYGSQTGSAESLARMMGMTSLIHGYAPEVCSMNDGLKLLTTNMEKKPDAIFFVCSTYGNGEFPTNAEKFAEALNGKDLTILSGVPSTVLGLGNSANDHFCSAGKMLAQKLLALGSPNLIPATYSCEMSPNGHEPAFRQWKHDIWAALGQDMNKGDTTLPVTYELVADANGSEDLTPEGYKAVTISSNDLLTPVDYLPAHHSIRFVADEAFQTAQLGRPANNIDYVMVMPKNSPTNVKRAMKLLGLDADAKFLVKPTAGALPSVVDGKVVTAQSVLTAVADLNCLPSRSILEALAMAATDAEEASKLEALANDLSSTSTFEAKAKGVWYLMDLLEEFKSIKLTLAHVLSHWPRIQPRTFSISADPAESETKGEIELTFVVSGKPSPNGTHIGLATGEMHDLKAGASLMIQLAKGSPALEGIPHEKDLVLIALGTGISPIRAILQARAAAARAGKTVGKAKLYYGFRHTGKNDLFMKQFKSWESKGVLNEIHAVGSYDTDKFATPMDHFDAELGDFIGSTGHIVYCGLGGGIPVIVENALRKQNIDVSILRLQKRYHEEYFTPDRDMENLFKDHIGSAGKTLTAQMGACDMFCFQCEQTFGNKGCSKVGVCGKTPTVSALQDLSIHCTKVLSHYLHELRVMGEPENEAMNRKTLGALFMTLTNVNFDEERFVSVLKELQKLICTAEMKYQDACKKAGKEATPLNAFTLPLVLPSVEGLVEMGKACGVLTRFTAEDEQSVAGVCEMLQYSLKGIAAYTDHSLMNRVEDQAIYEFIHRAMAFLISNDRRDLGKALGLLIESGKVNVTSMALLHKSNTSLGVPTPTPAALKPIPGKCILISGHDLIMLHDLLKKTEPLGINVYTHGETLPAHSYPELKKFKTLAGHFGGAWMRQSVEFPHFPGAILMTTNCLTEPHDSYKARVFTAGAVGWPGIPHCGDDLNDIKWDGLIACAQAQKGFVDESPFTYADPVGTKRPETYTVGFGHETILSVAPTIIEEIKKGNITRFFVVGGCDGFEGQRSYYTELVRRMDKTHVILTVGCGKYRINHLELGTIGDTGIPRLLDLGQCNDSYSAVQVALGLAQALNCEVTDLPLSIVLSWFEQKAIAVLLSCLALGLKPIHVGPSLPAFITPDVLAVLVKDYGIRVCGDPEEDLKSMVAAKAMS